MEKIKQLEFKKFNIKFDVAKARVALWLQRKGDNAVIGHIQIVEREGRIAVMSNTYLEGGLK